MIIHRGLSRFCVWAWFTVVLTGSHAAALELHPTAAAPTDLAVSGLLAGIGPDEKRFIRWADVAALPTSKLELTGEFLPGPQVVTVVYLADLWRALPRVAATDTLLAVCKDGYASVYTEDFIGQYRPFLVLEINGAGPDRWPPPGLDYNPGPYVISVSARVAPAVAGLLDAGHKKPWGVESLRLVRREEAFAGFYGVTLSDRARAGREIWINSCASCHRGPTGTFGGTKSDRPFEVVAAHARHNPDYFKKYIRAPQSFVSTAKMEPHPHYTDDQLETLITFLLAVATP
jgi:cytochrome c2